MTVRFWAKFTKLYINQVFTLFGTVFGYKLLQIAEKAKFLDKGRKGKMLETIIVILLVLWLIGVIGFSGTFGYLIHILLVVALAVFVIRFLTGRKVV